MAGATISTLLVRPVVGALVSSPPALESFYGATDLTPQMVADADARISPSQFCVAWAELVRLTGDPHIALCIADATPPGSFGIVEYVCRSAPTLGEALKRWVRYLTLLDDAVEVGLVEEGDTVSLRVLVESEAPAPASHELCFALVVAQARALSAEPFRPVRVAFAHRPPQTPEGRARYETWFGAKVTFGAKTTELVMTRSALASTLVSADANLLAILERTADDLHQKADREPPLTAQVKRVLRAALREDDSDVDRVAKRLGLSARNLQRRLKDEGAAFQTLREEVRKDLANRYLAEGMSIAEISFLLGFSQPSAFFRAFKRWTGRTPLESREALAPGAS